MSMQMPMSNKETQKKGMEKKRTAGNIETKTLTNTAATSNLQLANHIDTRQNDWQ
jgi:hypothetical protein